MKKNVLLLAIAIGIPIMLHAYNYVDTISINAVSVTNSPLKDRQGQTACPNIYYRTAKANEQATSIGKMALSGDTTIIAYFSSTDSQQLEKIERYLKDENGDLYRAGNHDYFQNGHLYCVESFRNKKLVSATYLDEQGFPIRRYTILNMKVAQRIDMYPGTNTVQYMEQINKDEVKSHYYDKQQKEIFPIPPSFEGGNEHLSELFSTQFHLPRHFTMNMFCYRIIGTMSKQGELTITNLKQTTSISTDGNLSNMCETLEDSIKAWLQTQQYNWKPGIVDGVPIAMPVDIELYYSPIYYAQSGDKLWCEMRNLTFFSVHQSDEIEANEYIFHQGQKNYFYALVERDGINVTLYYFLTFDNTHVLTEHYKAYRPDSVVKTGWQEYVLSEGDTLRYFYQSNILKSAEKIEGDRNVTARYTFYEPKPQSSIYKLKTKETYHPSGIVSSRTEFAEFTDTKDITTYYDESGKQAVFTPSKDANKIVRDYCKQYFKRHPFAVSRAESDGINDIRTTLKLEFSISETGEMTFIMVGNHYTWEYNYDMRFTNKQKIDRLLSKVFYPNVQALIASLKETKLLCSPALVDKKPISSFITVEVEVGESFL